jgi:hypothetical protein
VRCLRLVLVASMLTVTVGLPVPAQAANPYDAVVDLTFPVAGANSYIDDYDHCRGSGCSRRHQATDIMAAYGTPVHAAVGGRITWITGLDGNVPSYGYMITIAGDDGRSYNYIHLGHQRRGPHEAYAPGMRRGLRVERGQWIGLVGCSGNASCSAPHLHFEIVDSSVTDPYGGNRMNPYPSLRAAERRGDLPGPRSRFRDVAASATHYRDIERIAGEGITRGCNPPANDRFCPRDAVTREQMAAFLVRALGLNDDRHPGFRDVAAGSTFERDIRRLAAAGITRGCNPPANDQFCAKDAVSREQMAAFLARALELSNASHPGFRDVPAGSTFDQDIRRIARVGVTRGCNPPTNDRFCPKDSVTREQMASFLARALP